MKTPDDIKRQKHAAQMRKWRANPEVRIKERDYRRKVLQDAKAYRELQTKDAEQLNKNKEI